MGAARDNVAIAKHFAEMAAFGMRLKPQACDQTIGFGGSRRQDGRSAPPRHRFHARATERASSRALWARPQNGTPSAGPDIAGMQAARIDLAAANQARRSQNAGNGRHSRMP